MKWELQKLGYTPAITGPGRVQFEGGWSDVCKTNLWLRVADRVLVEVAQFDSPDFDALFDTTKEIAWDKWLPVDASFPVTGRSRLSKLTSVPAVQRTVKKAVVESLLKSFNTTELPETGPEYRIEIALLDDVAALTIDTTGPSLHKRGYRTSFGEAPIKETLAAAMVMLSVWNPKRPFVDPFCGSGTIAIEAALIARNVPPGINRKFAWQAWHHAKGVDIEDSLSTNDEPECPTLQISATDIDSDVLQLARSNAEKAGVASDIHFQQKSFDELRSKREYGCVITNPPYGERMSDRKSLLPLYRSFPAVLQRLPTWSHFIITNVPDFEGLIHQSATRRRKLYNGRIECMYYQFLGPRPPRKNQPPESGEQQEKTVVVEKPIPETANNDRAVFGGLTQKDQEQAELFATRLRKKSRHLRRWPTKHGITCFRLYERDIPELPFVVDRYEDFFHITEFERPHDRDPGRHAAWLELMTKSVAKSFDVPVQHVFLKSRIRQSGSQQYAKLNSTEKRIEVNEGGLKFLVNLADYVDTGLFLDHRKTRQMVRNEASGSDVLNLFAYTGSFSVYAASGGANSTTTVDWSRTYLDWAKENMRINGFVGNQHQFQQQDAVEFFENLPSSKTFDLIILDPPTFSNSKRTDNVWDVQKNHVSLLSLVAKHMTPNSVLYFSTNFRRFKFELDQIPQLCGREISSQTVPDDFRNKRIHRCWRLKRV